jgi:hypothetical protein
MAVSHTLTARENYDGLSQTLTARKNRRPAFGHIGCKFQKPRSAFAATVDRTEILIEAQIGKIADGKIPYNLPC